MPQSKWPCSRHSLVKGILSNTLKQSQNKCCQPWSCRHVFQPASKKLPLPNRRKIVPRQGKRTSSRHLSDQCLPIKWQAKRQGWGISYQIFQNGTNQHGYHYNNAHQSIFTPGFLRPWWCAGKHLLSGTANQVIIKGVQLRRQHRHELH